MTLPQRALEPLAIPETSCGAVVDRQLSVWPFAARTARLFLLVDPALPADSLRRGLMRAMQHAYFASDGYSQTRAVREAALAAHYVLRQRNRDVLPQDHVSAASAVAALRGDFAFVALAGQAMAFAWRDGYLTGQHGTLRSARPLGQEQDPVITLWSTPLTAGDRLALVCGATWRGESEGLVQEILSTAISAEQTERQLAETLGESRPASALVVAPGAKRQAAPHLRLVPRTELRRAAAVSATQKRVTLGQWMTGLLGAVLLTLVVLAAFTFAPARVTAPTPQAVLTAERVDAVAPAMAVRLGPAAANVLDLAVGDDALYTLDVVEASVREFALDALEQQPTPDTLLARTGMAIDAAGHRLGVPVAIEYLLTAGPDRGALAIIDQARSLVQVGHNRDLNMRAVPTSAGWRAVGALGSDAAGRLLFLDSDARQLLRYPPISQHVIDPPQVIVDGTSMPDVELARISEVLGEDDSVVVHLDDGSVHRLDANGEDVPIIASGVSGIAPDRAGGVYVAQPGSARILHTNLDGTIMRQLNNPALGGVRTIATSLDGRRLYALVATGVLVFDIPQL